MGQGSADGAEQPTERVVTLMVVGPPFRMQNQEDGKVYIHRGGQSVIQCLESELPNLEAAARVAGIEVTVMLK